LLLGRLSVGQRPRRKIRLRQEMLDSTDYSRRHEAEPKAALEALSHHDGTLLLDLDETAYLSNSTEDFLDSASPGLAALLLLRLLDAIRPWRWTGGEVTRDLWRIRLVGTFIPWIWILWRRRVKSLAAQFANQPLLDAVARRTGPTLFVSAGFQPIVAPLIAALGFPEARIVASRLSTTEDRLRGKFATALDALGEETVAKSMVLTDSLEDLPLLNWCARPLWTVWEDARYRPALSRIYVPGQYLTHVKRPGQRYILRGIFLEDFALWVLCSILHAPSPVTHVIGLLALLISFWAIYEGGYVDNDRVAHRHEKDPKLSDNFGLPSSCLMTPATFHCAMSPPGPPCCLAPTSVSGSITAWISAAASGSTPRCSCRAVRRSRCWCRLVCLRHWRLALTSSLAGCHITSIEPAERRTGRMCQSS
jgi:nitrogen fixation-related uncharacterized protein